MGVFRHPHLTRGVVHTGRGSFAIVRGIVQVPDDIGEEYGWVRVEEDDHLTAGWDRQPPRRTPIQSPFNLPA
jgi:hypothetical protein